MRHRKREVLWVVVGAIAAVACAACTAARPSAITPDEARRAFGAIYPGFFATSVEASGSAWLVDGYMTPDPAHISSVPVRVLISVSSTGSPAAVLDGRRWRGSADLALLKSVRIDSKGATQSLSDALSEDPDLGSNIVGVQAAPGGRVRVLSVTGATVSPPLNVYWSPDDDAWTVLSDEEMASSSELDGGQIRERLAKLPKGTTVGRGDPRREAILGALRVVAQRDLKQRVRFVVDTLRTANGWAAFSGRPVRPDGGAIDYSHTQYASWIKDGTFDEGILALLQEHGGHWHVVEYSCGTTDYPGDDWLWGHKVPADLFWRPE